MTVNGKILFLQHNANRNGHSIYTCLDYGRELKTDCDFEIFYCFNKLHFSLKIQLELSK